MKFIIQISEKRAIEVHDDIARGSEPGVRFYAMAAASTAIAAFGLMSNSTAVVIGAMLVAPLMTPIFGIALALVRGDTLLLARSIRAEVAGVILAVVLSACFGFIMPEFDATEQMLSRTRPNLIDLLVAIFSGFAGAYAMVDEHISPALPGVAIATAIVPPLANTGLCISLGAYQGAYGSFLLFFANFLSILLVASVIFFASGMQREFGSVTRRDIVRRFGLAAVGFLIVAALLSNGLYKLVHERRLKSSIHSVLEEELSHLSTTELQKVIHQKHEGKVYALAHVHAPTEISPSRVMKMEHALEKELEMPVELFVRSTLSIDVSSTGSVNQVITETLGGFFFSPKPDPNIKILKLAEQTIREFLATRLGLDLEEVNLITLNNRPIILATVEGIRKMSSEEIKILEASIQQRAGDDSLFLVFRYILMDLYDRWGLAHYEWGSFLLETPEQKAVLDAFEDVLKMHFKNSEHFLSNHNFTIREDVYHVLVELTGPRIFTQKEFNELKNKLTELTESQVELYVRSKPEVVVTEEGPTSFDTLKSRFLDQTETMYEEEIRKIVEGEL